MKQNKKFGRKNVKGFTLIELTVAMFVLTVGVLGGMVMILLGMTRDNTNRMDTTATNAAQAVLEVMAAVPANATPPLTVTDCLNNVLPLTTAGSAGGTGATLAPNGDVDFTQPAVCNDHLSINPAGVHKGSKFWAIIGLLSTSYPKERPLTINMTAPRKRSRPQPMSEVLLGK